MLKPGNKIFNVQYAQSVLSKDISKLPQNIKKTIQSAIETRLMTDPIHFGKPLRYSLSGLRSLRVGDYRIIYMVDQEELIVSIVSIAHRKDVYENL
jgi:addiction module RelE/StbE family toxin